MSDTDPIRQPRSPPSRPRRSCAPPYEAELKRVRVDDVLIQTVVSLLNLGGRRLGLAPGTEDEGDLDQVRVAIDAVRALLPLVERSARREPGAASGTRSRSCRWPTPRRLRRGRRRANRRSGEPGEPPPEPAGPGPAESSGRLWVPGS